MNRGFGEGEGPWGTLTVIYEKIKGGKNRHMNRNTDFRIKPRFLRVNIGRVSAVIFFKDSASIYSQNWANIKERKALI